MSKLSLQTKSFIALFCFAVFGTYVCLMLWSNLMPSLPYPSYGNSYTAPSKKLSSAPQNPAPVSTVDTSTWKSYADHQDGLTFLYKPGWKVLPAVKKDGFTVLQIDPGLKYYNIKIYISPKEFYIMDGVPTKTETIDGQTALNADNSLYGITANNLYYTFDVGLSMSLVPDFDALVYSAKFED